MRRVLIQTINTSEPKPFCEAIKGLAGEELDSELYELYGFSAHPEEPLESLLTEINGNPDNHLVFPPRGKRTAEKGTTLIYYGDDTEIVLSKNKIVIKRGEGNLEITSSTLKTNLDIETTGTIKAAGEISSDTDVKAVKVSLKDHVHLKVKIGTDLSGKPKA